MRRKNTQMTTNILIVSLLLIGVVYALLQTNLQINGIAKILHNTWDVHFDHISVNSDSVSINTTDYEDASAAIIDPEDDCKVSFNVLLSSPGDFYEFTYTIDFFSNNVCLFFYVMIRERGHFSFGLTESKQLLYCSEHK